MAKMSKAARSKAAQKAARTRKANKRKRSEAAKKAARARKRHLGAARRRSGASRRRRVVVSVRLNPKRGAKKGGAKRASAKRGARRASYPKATAQLGKIPALVNALADVKTKVDRVENRVDAMQKVVIHHSNQLRAFGMPKRKKVKIGAVSIIPPSHQLPRGPLSSAEEERLMAKYNPSRRRRKKARKGHARRAHRRGRR